MIANIGKPKVPKLDIMNIIFFFKLSMCPIFNFGHKLNLCFIITKLNKKQIVAQKVNKKSKFSYIVVFETPLLS